MAASPVLADSSYYVRLLRAKQDPLRSLNLAAATRDLAICGVVRCEVGRGIRDSGALKRFHASWDVMINIPIDNRLWAEVESTLWKLDRQGHILPLSDVIIGCCALRINAVVLTFDRHFAQIPGIRAMNRLDF